MLGCPHCFHLVPGFRKFSRYVYIFFMGWGCKPHTQPPTWRTRVSHLVWVITLMCLAWETLPVTTLLPTIALWIIGPRKPHHYVKVGISSVGGGEIKVQNSRLYDEVIGISYRHESIKKIIYIKTEMRHWLPKWN